MRRLAILGLSFLVVIGGLVALALHVFGAEARVFGTDQLLHRGAVRRPLLRRVGPAPLVFFMGDSTLWGRRAYPHFVAEALGDAADVRSLRHPGFDFYHYYFAIGEVLARRPALVVLVAHLRMFEPEGSYGMTDLISMIPDEELGRAALLPLHERGITLPELFASRLLRNAPGERALELHVGLRALLQARPGWRWLVPAEPVRDLYDPELRRSAFRRYDTPLYTGQPVVRMLEATVEMATRRGVAVIVVASPIPVKRLTTEGLYERGRFAARLEVLRRATESAGGRFLDLHRLLASEHFSDELGHTRVTGARQIARVLIGPVRETLERRAADTARSRLGPPASLVYAAAAAAAREGRAR